MKDNCAVVVTYNRCELLLECLQAIMSQTVEVDIIVVDNASTDNTQEVLERFISNKTIIYYNTGENLGGAGGFNFGIRKAYELGYERIWLMDDDTIPKENAFEILLDAARALNDEYGFLCSTALWTDETPCIMNLPEFSDRIIFERNLIDKAILPIKTATFVSFMITRSIVEKVGLPQKEFFIWADDTNYCIRISKVKQGYISLESIVVHKMKNNKGADLITDPGDNFSRYSIAYRNRFHNARVSRKVPKYLGTVFLEFFRILRYSKRHKCKRVAALTKGFFQGIFFRPKEEYI